MTLEHNRKPIKINGQEYPIVANEIGENAFVPLPQALWRSAGPCNCEVCQGKEGFWDTLAVPPAGTPYTVHYPQLQKIIKRR